VRIAFVVPRYGPAIIGGAETAARLLAEHLVARQGWEVDVLTSCAEDFVTWEDVYPEGETWIAGVRVVRFRSSSGRDPSFHPLSAAILADPAAASPAEAERWIDLQGPVTDDLAEAQALAALAEAALETEAQAAEQELPVPSVELELEDEGVADAEAGTGGEIRAGSEAAALSVPAATLPEAECPTACQASAKPPKRERRTQSRFEVDTSAVIYLINVGSSLSGRIVDLSLGGCHIRTREHFPVGIYTRVETEFRLEGLPFRMGGVIQSIHDRNNVGIRFLDLSERKRKQMLELIGEIEQMRAAQPAAADGHG